MRFWCEVKCTKKIKIMSYTNIINKTKVRALQGSTQPPNASGVPTLLPLPMYLIQFLVLLNMFNVVIIVELIVKGFNRDH